MWFVAHEVIAWVDILLFLNAVLKVVNDFLITLQLFCESTIGGIGVLKEAKRQSLLHII